MKVCTRCKLAKPINSFIKVSKKKDSYRTICKKCTNEYQRSHYRKNKDAYIKKNYRYRENLLKMTTEIKDSSPCADCGNYFDAVCMDFDHVGDDKSLNISSMVHACHSIKSIKNEIAKCEIVCANCHRIRTRDRRTSL